MTPRSRTSRSLAALAASLTTTALLALIPSSATGATGEWQDGTSQSDTMINCQTNQPVTGVTANAGWWSPTGQVPKVGEPFLVRGYIALVGMPCSSGAAVLPEILLDETAFSFPDEPVRWGINDLSDETPTLGTSEVGVFRGVNQGIVLTRDRDGEEAFQIARGEIFEFQFPVVAKRQLKGTATPAPTCYSRRAGEAPCPVAQSGDHMQIAFLARGHGGDLNYVTPYVPLFAQPATTPSKPGTPIPGAVTSNADAVSSTVRATYKVSAKKAGTAKVKVRSSRKPAGRVVVRDLARGGKVVGRAKVTPRSRGAVSVRIARLGKGVHRLVVHYLGSPTVKASSSKVKRVRLR